MKYEVAQDSLSTSEWRVEAIDFEGEGDCYVAIFSGPNAEVRATEYATWQQERTLSGVS